MKDPNLNKIVKEISVELNVSEDTVSNVCDSQFSFIVSKMKEYEETRENAPILLNHFGKFKVKVGRIKYLKEKHDREQ